jgi:hypothetical protein
MSKRKQVNAKIREEILRSFDEVLGDKFLEVGLPSDSRTLAIEFFMIDFTANPYKYGLVFRKEEKNE